ncbi:ABC transporter ATP-binding protein [Spiroplasma endosymbiont of Amphibalanus improvisus]|uniref:ABC transporter ATP-binding protein n=1 Tax=Spiroplasma endosymbiont of Amphibalanus improvisus TaxID=3066327 RepID=UPI00313BDF57
MLLEIKDATCGFGKKTILKNINLDFKSNTIYGLFGLNGAGKTTLIKTIFNELPLQKGQIIFNNHPINIQDYRQMFFFPENIDLPNQYIIKEYFSHINNYVKCNSKAFSEKTKELFNILLPQVNYKKQTIASLSSGEKKTVSLILCLALKPKIIFFDEPTANLDVSKKDELIKNIIKLKGEETILVLVSHLINELSSYLDDMIIIHDSKVVYNNNVSNRESKELKEIFLNHTIGKVELGNFDKYATKKDEK